MSYGSRVQSFKPSMFGQMCQLWHTNHNIRPQKLGIGEMSPSQQILIVTFASWTHKRISYLISPPPARFSGPQHCSHHTHLWLLYVSNKHVCFHRHTTTTHRRATSPNILLFLAPPQRFFKTMVPPPTLHTANCCTNHTHGVCGGNLTPNVPAVGPNYCMPKYLPAHTKHAPSYKC